MAVPRKSPRQQRSRETWEAILEAAAQLFQRHGYAATTTNKVAERAGVSIGSLYQYVPNKDALLTALAQRHLRAAGEELRRFLDVAAERRLGLRPLVAGLVATAAAPHGERPGAHRLLFDQTPRVPALVAELRAFEREIAVALGGHLRRLGLGGSDPEGLALLAVQGIEAQLHGAVLDPPPRDPAAGDGDAADGRAAPDGRTATSAAERPAAETASAASTIPPPSLDAVIDLWVRALDVPSSATP
ncbi:TetR/AcrR family transcriptional regulator [Streptomyces sp. AJS327]|uniref:TetR/AcrR family transcriptional regulator n=1 Tax=Streptomyces sp. AJS327 TaxID=2545265 RepID=UPI0015DF9245|nr:TetR/AcrR family transcriptional regulator [Streptomyces sp. AJS327]MBA0052913.1 TetR/AcrR family transcriptional regulator [Streptomyces sp. AJS327]